MWLPQTVTTEVDRLARIHYIDVTQTKNWNEHRRDGELRLLTGWCWTARSGGAFRYGLKTRTACYRDAWYALVARTDQPPVTRPRLRVVASERRSA